MKKTLGALSFAAVAWLGSTAYIGSNIESQSEKLLGSMQEKYKKMGLDLKIEIKDKSFFTSKAVMTLNYKDKSMSELVGAIYNLPMQMDYEIEHGPVFFKNGVGVGLIRMHGDKSIISFLNEDLLDDIKLSKEDLVMKSTSVIDFSNHMVSNMTISALKYNDNYDMSIDVSEMKGHFDFDLDTMEGTAKLETPLIKVYNPKQPTKDFVMVKDTTLNVNIDKFISDNIYLGGFTLQNKEITLAFSHLSKEPLVFLGDIDIQIEEDSDKNIKVLYKVDAEHLKGKIPEEAFPIAFDPKKVSFDLIVEGLSVKGLEAFQQYTIEIQKKTQELIEKLSAADSESRTLAFADLGAFQQEMQTKMIDLGQDIFTPKKGKISLNLNIEDENKKNHHANVSLAYIGEKLTGSMDEIMETFMLKAFESFKAKIDVSIEKSLITDFQKSLNSREQEQIGMGLMMGKAQGIIVEKDGAYKVNADYGPNKLILNNKDMSEMINMLKSSI